MYVYCTILFDNDCLLLSWVVVGQHTTHLLSPYFNHEKKGESMFWTRDVPLLYLLSLPAILGVKGSSETLLGCCVFVQSFMMVLGLYAVQACEERKGQWKKIRVFDKIPAKASYVPPDQACCTV